MTDRTFTVVGIRPMPKTQPVKRAKIKNVPVVSLAVMGLIILGCICAGLISTKDPSYMDLANTVKPPSAEFLFGTDTMGRDIWSCIWHGGRVSIFIGIFSTLISTVLAIIYGALSGLAPKWVDEILMRCAEILLSIPGMLFIIFLQAIIGGANVFSISVVIGITGWFGIAKIVRTEVKPLRKSEYVLVSRCMGGGFFHILRQHLAPNFVSAIMFMVVMNVRGAIVAESTLSFLGLGLSIESISWGSMLSLAENALNTGGWWIIAIPGAFLVVLVVCITNVGNWLRKKLNHNTSVL